MKLTLTAVALGLATLASPALAQDAAPPREVYVPEDAPNDQTPSDASTAEEPSEVKLALARRIVDQGFPEDLREEMFFASVDQLTKQMRDATLKGMQIDDEGAIAVMDGWLDDYIEQSKVTLRGYIPKLMDGLTSAYANIFTLQELTDIDAFVATPSGQRFMLLSSAVIADPDFAAVNQDYMNEIQGGLPSAMQDLQGRIMEYMSDKRAAETDTES